MSDFEQALIRAARTRQAQLAVKPAEVLAVEAKMQALHAHLGDTGGYGDIGWTFDLAPDFTIHCRQHHVTRAVWRHFSGDATALYPPGSRDATAIARSVDHAVELTAELVVGLLRA
ncbi:MAG: hypothetical protein AAFQ42_08660 [Pseudomonadota bacterium]